MEVAEAGERGRAMRKTWCACSVLSLACLLLIASSCSKPLASAKVREGSPPLSASFAAVPNDIYHAAKWALSEAGYSVASENLQDGVLESSWTPVTSDSHYIPLFERKDYGVTNSYHQLVVRIIPDGGRTDVEVSSSVKSLVANIKSSRIEERRVLEGIGDYLRKQEPALTNLGVDE